MTRNKQPRTGKDGEGENLRADTIPVSEMLLEAPLACWKLAYPPSCGFRLQEALERGWPCPITPPTPTRRKTG